MEQLELPVVMPERHATFNGWFGYEGRCADIALARDNPDMIEQCYLVALRRSAQNALKRSAFLRERLHHPLDDLPVCAMRYRLLDAA
jgi:hypothetical protein